MRFFPFWLNASVGKSLVQKSYRIAHPLVSSSRFGARPVLESSKKKACTPQCFSLRELSEYACFASRVEWPASGRLGVPAYTLR
jgi:hypothetical protein